MEKVLKIYSKKSENPALEITLKDIDSHFRIPMDNLFSMSARVNKKRAFLFVSKLIGKHIPIRPEVMNITGALMARKWAMDKYSMEFRDIKVLVESLNELTKYDLFDKPIQIGFNEKLIKEGIKAYNKKIEVPKKTLFIGFAETATGLANAVFSCFENAEFINTTRDFLKSVQADFIFREEHSHAVNHMIYSPRKGYFSEFEHIALVDDEITTGNTAKNLIEKLDGEEFSVLSILDWRKYPKVKDGNIVFSSLFKGKIDCTKNYDIESVNEVVDGKEPSKFNDVSFISDVNEDGFLLKSGRFGLNTDDVDEINRECEIYGKQLKEKRGNGKCLCIGDGEFIHIPNAVANYMGEDVFFQSATRSPVHGVDVKGYGNRNKFAFDGIQSGVKNYLYNIPEEYYTDVFFISEKEVEDMQKIEMSNIFRKQKIENIYFVSFRDEGGKYV